MRNASGHNYWSSSVIGDLAMWQIPRSSIPRSLFLVVVVVAVVVVVIAVVVVVVVVVY